MEKPQQPPNNYFFGVGPTAVEPKYLAILTQPLISHRDPIFVESWMNLMQGLNELLELKDQKPFATTGHCTDMYGSIAQLVSNRSKGGVLVVNSGPYGQIAMDELNAKGIRVHEVPVEYNKSVDLNQLKQKVKEVNPNVVLVIGSETPVGTYHLKPEIRDAIGPNTLLVVDEVSLMGGYDWNRKDVDFGFAGTQKCLMLPPGVQVGYVSERAQEKAKDAVDTRIRNLHDLAVRSAEGNPMATENVPLIRALEQVVYDLLQAGGGKYINSRNAELNIIYEETFLGPLVELGVSSFPKREVASPTVGVYIYNPRKVDLGRVKEAMLTDSRIVGGYDGVMIDMGFGVVNQRLMEERGLLTGRIPLFGQEPELVARILETQVGLMKKFSHK